MPADLPDFPSSQLFLRRLAYRLVREEALAEDLVQETWRAWLERAPAGLVEPRAWMARVLRNLAFNARRDAGRRGAREREVARTEEVEPETDGTLEAQARLVAALRALDEPYRSALVQRYYHDLSPKEIAERTGAPEDTVKSRLARGLAKLRADLDRRYGGDRRAWCHWLSTLARPGAGVPTDVERGPGARGAPSGRGAQLTPASGASSPFLLPGVVAGAALAVGTLCVVLWNDGRGEGLRAGVVASAAPERAEVLEPPRADRREVEGPSAEPAAAPAEEPRSFAAAPPPPEFRFEWPQFLGNAAHDPRGLRKQGAIRAPKVLWHEPEARGAPTFYRERCYVGGDRLLVLASYDGTRLFEYADELGSAFASSPVLVSHPREQRKRDERQYLTERDAFARETMQETERLKRSGASQAQLEQAHARFLERWEELEARTVALSHPALVLVRRLADGGITALDTTLENVLWSWAPSSPPRHVWPAALAGERVLVAADEFLHALDVRTGQELWRCATGPDRSAIELVPACDERSAYFASEDGLVHAVALESGSRRTLFETGGWHFGAHPVLFSTGLVLVDRGSALMRPAVELAPGEELWPGPNDRRGILWALRPGYKAEALWQFPYEGTAPSTPGVGRDGLLLGTRERVFALGFDGSAVGSPFKTSAAPVVTPGEHEGQVLVGTATGMLELYDQASNQRRWTFRLPPGERVEDVVWAGPRLFAATTLGLFCLANDPTVPPDSFDLVLDWTGALALELERARLGR